MQKTRFKWTKIKNNEINFKTLYNNQEIRVENSWFGGEKLFVNNELQDETVNYYTPARLTGHIIENGNKLPIKANLYSNGIGWNGLFIDDKKIKTHTKIKKSEKFFSILFYNLKSKF